MTFAFTPLHIYGLAKDSSPAPSGTEFSRTIFSFGSPCKGGHYGHLILRDGGRIHGYSNPNECAWSLSGEELSLYGENGNVTARLRRCGDAWFGYAEGRRWPLHLIPLLSLPPQHANQSAWPSILVNTIPKSGTYFVEAALNEIGCVSQRLHLSGSDTVDDYREVPDRLVHVDPEVVRLVCPVHLVTALLSKGEHVVGHIARRSVMEEILAQDVCVISVVRNLRDVLTSLLRFKLTKVASKGNIDGLWRELKHERQVIAFLFHYHDTDIAYLREVAEFISCDPHAIVLRYEQICTGRIASEASLRLDMIAFGMSRHLSQAFHNQYGRANPTYSGAPSHWQDIWNDDVERFFVLSGLADVNRALGYA